MYEQNSFEPVARVVQLASHIEQKRLADIAYETRRFVRIGESEETINQRIQDKSQPLINIYHYHCNHLGTPQELSDEKGEVLLKIKLNEQDVKEAFRKTKNTRDIG